MQPLRQRQSAGRESRMTSQLPSSSPTVRNPRFALHYRPGLPASSSAERPDGCNDQHEQEAERLADQRPAAAADFSKIPIFPPDQPVRPHEGFSLVTPPPSAVLQPEVAVGPADDPLEREADSVARRVMRVPNADVSMVGPSPRLGRKSGTGAGTGPYTAQAVRPWSPGNDLGGTPARRRRTGSRTAPGIVHKALHSAGQSLGNDSRAFFEPRFGHDLSHIRIHAGQLAAQSARALNARAYTVSNHIVFGAGQYQPGSAAGRMLLAHEIAHVLIPSSAQVLRRQPATAPAPPRQDLVFIMGADAAGTKNHFFREALRFYRAHLPGAVFNTSERSLSGLLNFLGQNVHSPIANLYIVSHGNEDGTLTFALDETSGDDHLTVSDLRNALHPATGTSTLPSVSAAIDSNTRIHIKGCNIGRTQEMVELLDEAFGGAGTVTAPTHEQDYSHDPVLAGRAQKREHDRRMAEFSSTLEPVPPMPGPIDRHLRGAERAAAVQERAAALKERQAVISARAEALRSEEQRIAPELEAAAERGGTEESLSGPMFQRPGTRLFTEKELQPEVDRLYGHLTKGRRHQLVRTLVAPDRRSAAVVRENGTVGQVGQRIYRHATPRQPFSDPKNLAEAKHQFRAALAKNHFTPSAISIVRSGNITEITLTGKFAPPHAAAQEGSQTFTITEPDRKELIADGRELVENPDRYAWRIERTHRPDGTSTLSVVGERVVAYIHHGSLSAGPHDPFTKPETDPDFYATSTFAPPVPPSSSP